MQQTSLKDYISRKVKQYSYNIGYLDLEMRPSC